MFAGIGIGGGNGGPDNGSFLDAGIWRDIRDMRSALGVCGVNALRLGRRGSFAGSAFLLVCCGLAEGAMFSGITDQFLWLYPNILRVIGRQ